MTFPTTPALAFTAGVSTISAVTANAWRSYFPKALDAVGGGVYTNLAEIEFPAGSSGWKFGALVTLDTTSTVLFQAGGAVTINSDPTLTGTLRVGVGGTGGAIRLYATSTLTVDDTVAMTLAGDATWTSASTSTYAAGSTLAINTALATLGQDGILTINGASGHGALVSVGQYGSIVLAGAGGTFTGQSGSIFTLASGAFVTVTIGGGGNAGTLTVGADGDVIHASGSTDTYQNGSALTTNTGSIVNLNIGKTNAGTVTNGSLAVEVHESGSSDTYDSGSALNLNGVTTRTGKMIRSGTGAWEGLRFLNGNLVDSVIDARDYDFINVQNYIADIVYTLTNLTGNEPVTITIRATSAANTLTVKNGGGTTLYTFSATGQQQSAQFVWTGALWMVGVVGVAF